MRTYYKLIILFVFLATPYNSYARECTPYEKDKMQVLSEKAANDIVLKYGGGINIYTTVNMCEFNLYSKKYRVNIKISWFGMIRNATQYIIEGDIDIDNDEKTHVFTQRYANESVKDLAFFLNIVKGAALTLYIINNEIKTNNSNPNKQIEVDKQKQFDVPYSDVCKFCEKYTIKQGKVGYEICVDNENIAKKRIENKKLSINIINTCITSEQFSYQELEMCLNKIGH